MDSTDLVSKVTQRMVSVFDPQAIYLFGSRAWGQPTEDSDVDLLVVVKSSDEPPWTRASKGFAQLRGVGVGCDLIVKTEAEVQAEGRFASSLMAKILRDGKKVNVCSRERVGGRCQRGVSLPEDGDAAQISASYRDGVLHISVPRREAAQPKRITIQ